MVFSGLHFFIAEKGGTGGGGGGGGGNHINIPQNVTHRSCSPDTAHIWMGFSQQLGCQTFP